ncbi:MAG: hypothetical protein ACKO37_04665 [Vampirovibrionales bacterium]
MSHTNFAYIHYGLDASTGELTPSVKLICLAAGVCGAISAILWFVSTLCH